MPYIKFLIIIAVIMLFTVSCSKETDLIRPQVDSLITFIVVDTLYQVMPNGFKVNGSFYVDGSVQPDGYKVEGHLTPFEVGEVARQAKVKKVILTHLYPLCDQYDVVCQVKKRFRGEVIRAEDLMKVTI